MLTVSISEFKARCLGLLQHVNETKETLIITKHGRPFAEIRPCARDLESALEGFRGSVVSYGDLASPVGEDWEAAQ